MDPIYNHTTCLPRSLCLAICWCDDLVARFVYFGRVGKNVVDKIVIMRQLRSAIANVPQVAVEQLKLSRGTWTLHNVRTDLSL